MINGHVQTLWILNFFELIRLDSRFQKASLEKLYYIIEKVSNIITPTVSPAASATDPKVLRKKHDEELKMALFLHKNGRQTLSRALQNMNRTSNKSSYKSKRNERRQGSMQVTKTAILL